MALKDRYNLIKSKRTEEDELVDKILAEESSPEKTLYEKALALHSKMFKRRYVEAALIATQNTEEISAILKIPSEVLDMYVRIFYDIGDYDTLDKLELLDVKDKEEAMLKAWAMAQGLEFLNWRLGNHVQIDPVEGLMELFTLATYKSKEAMFSATAETSETSIKWSKLSMDLARLIKSWVLDGDSAKRDIELALRKVNPNFDGLADVQEDMGIPLEELIAQNTNFPGLPKEED